MPNKKPWWLVVAGGVAVVALAILVWRLATPRQIIYKGIPYEPPIAAPDFTLVDHNGQPFQFGANRADATLLFFGYTFCPDVCPGTLAAMRRIKQDLGRRGEGVQVLFVTVDPERDTPARLQQYLERFGSGFTGLTGTPEQIAAVTNAYGVVAKKEPEVRSGAGYLVSHTALVFLIDRNQQLRVRLPYALPHEDILHDVQAVLAR